MAAARWHQESCSGEDPAIALHPRSRRISATSEAVNGLGGPTGSLECRLEDMEMKFTAGERTVERALRRECCFQNLQDLGVILALPPHTRHSLLRDPSHRLPHPFVP